MVKKIINKYRRVFVISDLHGYYNFFEKALDQMKFTKDDLLIINGDSCDRGPDSDLIYRKVIQLQESEHNIVHILGNHEQMMFDYFLYSEGEELWMNNGGKYTLERYIHRAKNELDSHLDLFESMPTIVTIDNYIISHGGININYDLEHQKKEDLLWMNPSFKETDFNLIEKKIVFGHRITPSKTIEFYKNSTIGIDCGLYKGGKLGILELNTEQDIYI